MQLVIGTVIENFDSEDALSELALSIYSVLD